MFDSEFSLTFDVLQGQLNMQLAKKLDLQFNSQISWLLHNPLYGQINMKLDKLKR